MTPNQLADVLRDMLQSAAKGDRALSIHLFGIKYADEIVSCGGSPKEIAKAAGIGESYGTEIRKGVRLSERVVVKDST